MKKTFSVHAAVILTTLALAAAPVFAAETTTTQPAAASTTTAAATTTTAAPAASTAPAAKTTKPAAKKVAVKNAAAIKVPAISVSKYGEKAAGAFTVSWADASNGKYTYTLYRAEADKNGKLTGAYAAVTSAKNADNSYSATDTVAAEKYYKYRLAASEGKTTVKGTASALESSVTAAAAADTTAPAVKK